MNSQEMDRIDYYINPNDLLNDEIDYELKLRCLPIDGSLEIKRQRLKHAQLEEVRKPKVLRSKVSIAQEYDAIREKVQDIKHAIQFYPESKFISRLRHCRLRVIRANAVTREQGRLKNEFLTEIEDLLDRYGNPLDRRGSQLPPNVHMSMSAVPEPKEQHESNEKSILNFSDIPGVARSAQMSKQHIEIPNPNEQRESGLLDEAAGGRESSGSIEEELDLLFAEFRQNSQRREETNREPLLPYRKNQSGIGNPAAVQGDHWKEEINRYIQQALSEQMSALMEKLTPMLANQRASTPVPPPSPPLPPPPPVTPPPQMHRHPDRQEQFQRVYPNSIASHVSFAGNVEREPEQMIRPNGDPRARWQVPVSKWRINFSGDSRGPTVTQFLNKVEILARNNKITDQELLSQANFFFKENSEAEEWYFTFCHKFTTWARFKHQLRLRFEQPNKDKVIERQILDRRQLPNETFNAFLSAVEKLAQQLTKPLSEERKLDILKENMKDCYKPFLTIYRIERIDELTAVCHELDKSMYRNYGTYPRNRIHQVNNVEEGEQNWEDEEYVEEEVNAIGQAIRKNKAMQRTKEMTNTINQKVPEGEDNVLCWNCRQYGHFWRNCNKQKKIFCHYCGQMNYVTANCPNNHRFPVDQQGNENSERL